MTTTAVAATFPDDPTLFDNDDRVTPRGPGQYTVTGPAAVYYVLATQDFGWVVTTDPGLHTARLGGGVLAGFENGDLAIEAALHLAATRTSR